MPATKQIADLSLSDLEHLFAKDLKSPVFVNLAEKYFEKREYKRALKVCEIGLSANPYNILGKFLLSKIYFCIGKLIQSEKILIDLVSNNPNLINAFHLLKEVQVHLKRDPEISKKYSKESLLAFSKNTSNENIKKNKVDDLEQKIDDGIKTEDASFEIDHNMATFAFYKIVKSQKKYPYAKSILACIEKKDGLTPKINEEKKVLNSLIENKFSK